jgi:hypothetical protein
MRAFASSPPFRWALTLVLAVVVQRFTHWSWLSIAPLVTYLGAKEVAGAVWPGAAGALLGADRTLRIAAFAFDNLGYGAAIFALFAFASASPGDGGALWQFAAVEAAVVLLVAAWGFVGAAALQRSAVVKV